MGNYVTEPNIMELMPQLPKTATAGYTATSALMSLTIDIAESYIDGYVGRRYSLPFTTVPLQIRSIAKDLSVYLTYKRLYPSDNMNRNAYAEGFESDENNAYKKLEQIQDGDLWLTLTDGSVLTKSASDIGIDSTTRDYQSVFDMDDIVDSKVDHDLLSEIKDAR